MTVKLTLVDESTPAPSTRCTAYARTVGRTCQRPAIPGGAVCDIHGGSVPATRAAAHRKFVEAQGLAIDLLIMRLAEQFDSDPMFAASIKDITEVADKLTRNTQLLSGEATERKESRSADIKLQVNAALDQLGQRLGTLDVESAEFESAESVESVEEES